MLKRIFFIWSIFLVPIIGMADSSLELSVDKVFSHYDISKEPGCVAGIIHKGEYSYAKGFGLANMEHNIALTKNSVFRIGSVSKQFTAMAIAILVERELIDLDADVHMYLPELMDYQHEVTVRQMIHHIAGMGDYDHKVFTKSNGELFRWGNEDYVTVEEFFEMVIKANLVHEPTTRYQYSNLGYFLLGQVVERVSGQSLREFAKTEIFDPLSMNNTHFNDNVDQVISNRAYGYQLKDEGYWEVFMTNLDIVGDGGVFTTLEDFIKWDQNFYTNKLGKKSEALISMMQTPYPDVFERTKEGDIPVNYAFALNIDEAHGEIMIGHGGSWVAFTSFYNRFPRLNTSVVVFCNSLEQSAYEIGEKIVNIAIPFFKENEGNID